MSTVATLLVCLLGLALTAQLAGTLIGPLSLMVGSVLLAMGILSGLDGASLRRRPRLLVPAGLVLLCGVLLLLAWPHGRVNCLFAFCILLVGTDVAFRAFGRSRPALYAAARQEHEAKIWGGKVTVTYPSGEAGGVLDVIVSRVLDGIEDGSFGGPGAPPKGQEQVRFWRAFGRLISVNE